MVTINLLFIITLLAGALAVVDGVIRVRGRRSNAVLAIAEIVFGVFVVISLFVALPAPLTLLLWLVLLEITLVLVLVLRGTTRRGIWAITIIALLLNTVALLVTLGWLTIPGLL